MTTGNKKCSDMIRTIDLIAPGHILFSDSCKKWMATNQKNKRFVNDCFRRFMRHDWGEINYSKEEQNMFVLKKGGKSYLEIYGEYSDESGKVEIESSRDYETGERTTTIDFKRYQDKETYQKIDSKLIKLKIF